MTKYTINSTYLDMIDSHRKAYILGLIYADGNINKKCNQLNICTTVDNKDWLQNVVMDISPDIDIKIRRARKEWNQSRDIARLIVCNQHICKSLLEHGVVPCKSLHMSIPQIDESYVNSFICGYFDGDGNIGWRVKDIYMRLIITGQKNLLMWIQAYLTKQHMKSHIYADKRTNAHYLQINSQTYVKMFMDLIYRDVDLYMPAKRNKYIDMSKRSSCKVWTNLHM